jgi:Zn-dependent protease with chaperone function
MKRKRQDASSLNSFKALFISDPDRARSDAASMMHAGVYTADQRLVQDVLSRKVTTLDRVGELLSSHPNIVKRLRALQKLA